MSELARSLRRSQESGFSQENPLVAIGVASNVLDLGMTEDELFDYIIKDVGRRLVLRFHSDGRDFSGRPEIATQRGRISELYRLIQDRTVFNRALAEFRNLKSEERSEIRVLRRALEDARQRLDSYRAKETRLVQGLAQFEKDREVFDQEVSKRQAEINNLLETVDLFKLGAERAQSAALEATRRLEDVRRYVYLLSEIDRSTYRGPHAFEARWVAVASLVSPEEEMSANPPRFAFWIKKKFTRDFTQAAYSLGATKQSLEEIAYNWNEVESQCRASRKSEPFGKHDLYITLLSLSAGKPEFIFGSKRALPGGRIIGSIPTEEMGITRGELTTSLPSERVLPRVIPRLVPNGLAVRERSIPVRSTKLVKRGLHPTRFHTRCVILSAG